MQPLDVVAMIAELLAWVGLALGVLALIAFIAARLSDGVWEPVDIVVVDREEGPIARWFAEGEFHERGLSAEEREHIGDASDVSAYTRIGSADRLRFEQRRPIAGVLGLAAGILIAVGFVGLAISIVLTFIG